MDGLERFRQADAELKNNSISSHEADRILCLTLDVAEGMLRGGGEVHRVEDTIGRLCRAYGAEHTEIFAIPTMILAAIRMPDGSYSSQMRRVENSEYNMFKVELFNEISRKACRTVPPLSELDGMIKAAKRKKSYHYSLIVLGSMLLTGFLCVFYGGSWRDGLVAAAIGGILCLCERIPQQHINGFAKTAMQSFVAGIIGCLAVLCGIGEHADKIMMGTIMYSIPGLAFGIAARDMLFGDFLAGSLKLIQALLTALMIAFGYLLAMLLFSGVL